MLGGLSFLLTKGNTKDLSQRWFCNHCFVWVVLGFAGSIPFYLNGMSFTDAIFEFMSGITTTGYCDCRYSIFARVIVILDNFFNGWGMGLIVLAIAVMPLLGIGGGQLHKTDIPGAMGDQRLTPRIKETAQALWIIYVGLTVICALLYLLNGMTVFDAISHAMSTVAIGGFSTYNESIGYFNSLSIEIICMSFMILSALSFALHYFALYKKKPLKYFFDPEFKFFIGVICIILITCLV